MKYCIKCESKLKENNKFCSNCGHPTSLFFEEKKKEKLKKKEENKERLLLSIGAFLIILASIIFAFANWNEMTDILKVLFLSMESLIFLSFSIFSKRLNYKMPYKFLWFIGILFIPIIFEFIAYNQILGNYLSYKGSGIYVYLAICYFISFIVFLSSYRFLKSNIFIYISLGFLYYSLFSVLGIFKLNSFVIAMPILNMFNLITCILYLFIKNQKLKQIINRFLSVILIIFSIYTLIYTSLKISCIPHIITYISIIISLIILIFNSKRNILIYFYPFFINLIIISAIDALFIKYINITLFMSLLLIIMINFIINIKDNYIMKNTSYIFMILFSSFIILIYNVNYLTLSICGIILFIVSLFIIRLKDQKTQVIISKLLLPILLLVIINSLINLFLKVDLSIVYLVTSIICFSIFIVINKESKEKISKTIFEIFSYAFIIIASLIVLFNKPIILAFILVQITWIYYFVYNKVIKRNNAINIWLLVMLIINFVVLSIRYCVSYQYSLVFISLVSIILDFIELKIYNKKTIYIYISMICTMLSITSNLYSLSILGVSLVIIAYVFSYYLYNKKYNNYFIIKFLYTLSGFGLIYLIFNYFIDKVLLVNILVLIMYIILLVSMFLLQTDSDRKVFSYSLVIIYPYIKIIDNIKLLSDNSTSLIVLLAVTLVLIYFEKVFKLKEKEKIVFELILIGLIHLFTIFDVLLINFALSVFYILYGIFKKRDAFTIFGTILLILVFVANVYKIFNNISVTYVLLVLGLIMLVYVFYIEAKKKNSKK